MHLESDDIKHLKQGADKDCVKVIDYFTKEGCFSGIMKDEQYFGMVKSFADTVTAESAAAKLGIDLDDVQEISPVHLSGFKLHGRTIHDDGDCLWKRTESGRLLSSVFEVTWLFFSNEQLYLYEKKCVLHKNRKTTQMTNEFFYKDVVSLATADVEAKNKRDAVENVDVSVFNLTVPGDQITVALDPTDDTEAAIQGMKQKVREKKQSA